METFNAAQRLKQLKYRQEIQQFNSNLQKGDLGLSQVIDYGYILYGQTRTGKTASGHILSGNSLKGTKINGQQVVEATTSRNRKARIGNAMNSQTLIPNFFDVKLKNNNTLSGKICVVDTPGYGDTYGILRVLANGYYHYRLYSKVKNMKFILCFDVIQLKNTGQAFIETIMQFTASFKDYLEVKQQIWKSCAFLFTKVDEKQYSLSDLVQKLRAFIEHMRTQHDTQMQNSIKQLIKYIIDSKRIFFIKKIKKGDTANGGDLLQEIDCKLSHWWSRDYDEEKKMVDMEPVSFALAKQIIILTTQSNKPKNQFIELIQYYNIRIKQFVQEAFDNVEDEKSRCSLSYVLQELVKDAMGHPDSHNFLDVMSNYVDIYYQKYDQQYKEEREKREKQLFALQPEQSQANKSYSRFKGRDKNYLIKKFKSLKKIEEIKNEISASEFDERNLSWLETCQKNLFDIIRELNRVAYKRNKSAEVIFKYGYLIHRIVQEAKVFLQLIELSSTKENSKKIRDQANGEFIDLMRLLKDFMGVSCKYNNVEYRYEDVHLQFVKRFSLKDENYKTLTVNESFIEFFTSADSSNDEDSEKIVHLVLKYSDQILNESEEKLSIGFSQTTTLIKLLNRARSNAEIAYHMKHNQEQKDCNLFLIRRTTKNLGRVLEFLGKYELSRKVYDTVKYVDSVCKLYREQIKQLNKIKAERDSNKQKLFELRIEYSKYLANHLKETEAIEILQETFELAQNMGELNRIKEELSEMRLQIKDPGYVSEYETNLFNGEEYFVQFNGDLQTEILSLTEGVIGGQFIQ